MPLIKAVGGVIAPWVYVPSLKDLAANASVYLFLLVLAGVFHYLTDASDKVLQFLNPKSPSVHTGLLLLLVGFVLNFVPIFFAIDNYFINSKQTIRAACGTTVCVCALYALLWKVFEGGIPSLHSFAAILCPDGWRRILRVAMTGSLVSVVSSFRLGFGGNLESFDFKEVRRMAYAWKGLVAKLTRDRRLSDGDHQTFLELTTGIRTKLEAGGRVQPSVVRTMQQVVDGLVDFGNWYQRVTRVAAADANGLDAGITPVVANLERLF